jgi:plastocyanin
VSVRATVGLGTLAVAAAIVPVLPGTVASAVGGARAPQPAGSAQLTFSGPGAAQATPSSSPAAAPTSAAPAGAAPPGAAPAAAVRLVAAPSAPRAGQRVSLRVPDPLAGATRFVWTRDGAPVPSAHPGPRTTMTFATPGAHSVAVSYLVGESIHSGVLAVEVSPKAAATTAHHRTATRRRAAGGHRRAAGRHTAAHRRATGAVASDGLVARVTGAHAAGDPGVTIADFHFSPGTTTVHAGDTITWTNNGPSAHTATAKNGAFDTGVLQKGQSASHTFTQPGTYTYFCQIHPFMHGTIVVLASTTTTTPAAAAPTSSTSSSSASAGTDASSTPSTSSTTSTAAAQPTLPLTGLNVLAGLTAGLVLLGGGALLRRLLAAR